MKRQASVSPGTALVGRIRTEMEAEGLEPTALENELLANAEGLQNRVVELEEAISAEGLTKTSKSGVVHLHPAVAEARQTRAVLARVLSGISISDDAKNPVKVRAAQSRWRAHNEAKKAVYGG